MLKHTLQVITNLQQAWLVEDGSVERAVPLDRGVGVGGP